MINTNIKKQQQQTTGLIPILKHTTYVNWCYCLREVLFQKVFVCCLQACPAWKTISYQRDKGNRVKHVQFSLDIPVWRMMKLMLPSIKDCIVHMVLYINDCDKLNSSC